MSFKYINMVACEIEAGWDYKREDLHKDASLILDDFEYSESIGELVSKPYDDIKELFSFMEKNWGTEFTNRCSFHVHFSFKNIDSYVACMNEKFYYDYFLPQVTAWAKKYPVKSKLFWSRLNDENRYCRARWIPEKQIQLKKKPNENRYTHINFCWGMHKTFEVRLLPMFKDVNVAKSAIKLFINCIEQYLTENPPQTQSLVKKSLLVDIPKNDERAVIENVVHSIDDTPYPNQSTSEDDAMPNTPLFRPTKIIKRNHNFNAIVEEMKTKLSQDPETKKYESNKYKYLIAEEEA